MVLQEPQVQVVQAERMVHQELAELQVQMVFLQDKYIILMKVKIVMYQDIKYYLLTLQRQRLKL
jgi:hypothetical protein